VPRVVWTPPALRDIARLHSFLVTKNRIAARRAIRAIRQGVKGLAKHPETGRPIEDLSTAFREWFIEFGDSGYLTLYRYEGEVVAILAVRHVKEAGY